MLKEASAYSPPYLLVNGDKNIGDKRVELTCRYVFNFSNLFSFIKITLFNSIKKTVKLWFSKNLIDIRFKITIWKQISSEIARRVPLA